MNTANTKLNTIVRHRELTGVVVSNKMKDTVVVEVRRFFKYPKYGKYVIRSKRLKAHDAGNTCSMGDRVIIRETRPLSKDKHHMVVKKITAQVSEAGNLVSTS